MGLSRSAEGGIERAVGVELGQGKLVLLPTVGIFESRLGRAHQQNLVARQCEHTTDPVRLGLAEKVKGDLATHAKGWVQVIGHGHGEWRAGRDLGVAVVREQAELVGAQRVGRGEGEGAAGGTGRVLVAAQIGAIR